MIRAFAAIALPDEVRQALGRVQATLPVPRLVPPENLHLTLVFLGAVAEPVLDEVHTGFAAIRAPGFDLVLEGLGLFGRRPVRSIHAQVADAAGPRHLQAKVEQAARGAGVRVESRRFTPHVTLARLGTRGAEPGRLDRALAAGAAFRAGPFAVDSFGLYRSDLGHGGPHYTELARYPLPASPDARSGP